VLDSASVPARCGNSSIGGKAVAKLDDFVAAIASLPDGERAACVIRRWMTPRVSENSRDAHGPLVVSGARLPP
jgi:hypothetical protein